MFESDFSYWFEIINKLLPSSQGKIHPMCDEMLSKIGIEYEDGRYWVSAEPGPVECDTLPEALEAFVRINLTPPMEPKPATTTTFDGIFRRNRTDKWTPAEKAIADAVWTVEEAGADIRLTEAVTLLGKAREYVADYVDNVPYRPMPLTFMRLQGEHRDWSLRNFGEYGDNWWKPVFGIMEELGELSHALLKQSQGIRGSTDEHETKAKDAIGDLVIFIASVCSARGWDLQQIVEATWDEVKQRDYSKMTEK